MTDTEVLLRSAPVRKYCLQVFHRYRESGHLGHEARAGRIVGNLIEYLEKTRSKLHEEASEFLIGEGLTEPEAKEILVAECERLAARVVAISWPNKDPHTALPKGQSFCGCCQEIIPVADISTHRATQFHKEVEREALIVHTGAFPMAFLGVWQCQVLLERAQKTFLEESKDTHHGTP